MLPFSFSTNIKRKSLNKKHLVALLDLSDGYNKWLTENKNKLRGETDWVNFLQYYNSKQ